MKTLKGWITTTCLVAMLMISATTAKADGVIIGGLSNQPVPCSQTTKTDFGVIIGGFTGVIIGGFTGVIIGGLSETSTTNCGVIIGG